MARTVGLLVRDLGDETIVYDLARHQAHCLNRTAYVVSQAECSSKVCTDDKLCQ